MKGILNWWRIKPRPNWSLTLGGDSQAFGVLVERYQLLAFKLALGRVANPELARELVQEAMLQAFLSLPHLRQPDRFKNWFYGLVLNVCRNYQRQQSRTVLVLPLDSLLIEPHSNRLDLEEWAEKHELRQTVAEAVAALSPKNQAVTHLFYYQQLSLEEIAAQLQISLVAVKSRLHQARQQLKERLNQMKVEHSLEEPSSSLIKLKLAHLFHNHHTLYDTLVLVDEAETRVLPLWVGQNEGAAIANRLGSGGTTYAYADYNLTTQVLKAARFELKQLRLERLKGETFFAVLNLVKGKTRHELKTRPAEGIALALLYDCPIVIDQPTFEQVALLVPDQNELRSGPNGESDSDKKGLTQSALTPLINSWIERHYTPQSGIFWGGLPEEPLNLAFTEGLSGWYKAAPGSDAPDYEVGLEEEKQNQYYDGTRVAFLQSSPHVVQPRGYATLMQNCRSEQYRGQRIRLSAYLRTENVETYAGLWLRVDSPEQVQVYNMRQPQPFLKGTTTWRKYEYVVDIPAASVGLAFGIALEGQGKVWVASFKLEGVAQTESLTQPGLLDPERFSVQPLNLNFEQGLAGWLVSNHQGKYQIKVEEELSYRDNRVISLKSETAQAQENGAIAQVFRAGEFKGKRLRLSGYLKAQAVEYWAGLWLQLDDLNRRNLLYLTSHEENPPVQGNLDWQLYTLEVAVPLECGLIGLGVSLSGSGQLWAANLRVKLI